MKIESINAIHLKRIESKRKKTQITFISSLLGTRVFTLLSFSIHFVLASLELLIEKLSIISVIIDSFFSIHFLFLRILLRFVMYAAAVCEVMAMIEDEENK